MPITVNRDQLAAITQGTTAGESPAASAVGADFDSRTLKPGELFVAVRGATVNGESFLKDSFKKGAPLALVESKELLVSEDGHRVIVVQDTAEAFLKTAEWWRGKLSARVLSITGSMGKTTAKEMAAHILAPSGAGHYSNKSFNGQLGVPYTVCAAGLDAKWLVLEMGMSQAGELSRLARVALPNAVLMTGIAPVHIEFFASLEAIAAAKCELLEGLDDEGIVILNGDDEVLLTAASSWMTSRGKKLQTKTFGFGAACDYRVSNVTPGGLKQLNFTLTDGASSADFQLPTLPARHYALLAAGAVAAARAIEPELSLKDCASQLATFAPPPMRLSLITTTAGSVILDDSYNANPQAMLASIDLIKELAGTKRVGLILGDMRELGSHGEKYHREVGRRVAQMKPAFLACVGELSKFVAEEANAAGVRTAQFQTPEEAAGFVVAQEFDFLLVKGSRGIALDKAVVQLKRALGESA